jgi:hypothetical protein
MTDFGTLRQHQVLSRLLNLSRDQYRALEDEDLDTFLALMDEREQVMSGLLALEASPAPTNILPFPTITSVGVDDDVQAAMAGLIRSILRQDDDNEALLRLQMDAVQTEITKLNRGAVAGRGYAAALSGPRTGVGIDLMG